MRKNSRGGGGGKSGSEVTVMEIEDLRKFCVREMEDHFKRRIIGNHKDLNKGCSRKKKIRV